MDICGVTYTFGYYIIKDQYALTIKESRIKNYVFFLTNIKFLFPVLMKRSSLLTDCYVFIAVDCTR